MTFAWLCGVGDSRLLGMARIPPLDSLTDEKSLTTKGILDSLRGLEANNLIFEKLGHFLKRCYFYRSFC